MNLLYAFRYFQVVPVVPPLFIGGFVVAVGAAGMRLVANPSAAVDALSPVLLLQLFAASSGFRHHARRGHYDLLLTSGTPRWQIALAHCVSSIAPGVAAWVTVGVVEMAVSHGTRFSAFGGGASLAFLTMSLVAWAGALSVSRPTAAVAWLLAMTIHPLSDLMAPATLLGFSHVEPWFAFLVLAGLALLLAVTAFVHIVHAPVPLEASQ